VLDTELVAVFVDVLVAVAVVLLAAPPLPPAPAVASDSSAEQAITSAAVASATPYQSVFIVAYLVDATIVNGPVHEEV